MILLEGAALSLAKFDPALVICWRGATVKVAREGVDASEAAGLAPAVLNAIVIDWPALRTCGGRYPVVVAAPADASRAV